MLRFFRSLARTPASFTFRRSYALSTGSQGSTQKFPVAKSIAVSSLTVLGLWYYFHSQQAHLQQKKEREQGQLGTPKIGGPFTLPSHHGHDKPFSFPSDLNGAYALIYFGFTHCPDICPEELDKISEAIEMVEKADAPYKLQTIFVTCDPERDSPKVIAEYLKDFHPSIIGVTGELDMVKEAARLFRVYFKAAKTGTDSQDYLVDHTIFYYLMDPQGRYVTHYGREHRPKEVAQSILEIMRDAKKKNQHDTDQ